MILTEFFGLGADIFCR